MLYAKWHLQITHFDRHLITIIDGRMTTKLNKQKEQILNNYTHETWNLIY